MPRLTRRRACRDPEALTAESACQAGGSSSTDLGVASGAALSSEDTAPVNRLKRLMPDAGPPPSYPAARRTTAKAHSRPMPIAIAA